jgi:hypothetical protein
MANNSGTLVIAAIRPWSDADTFASAYADEIRGGLHCVTTDASRDAITSDRLEDGMLVAVSNSAEAGGNRAIYQRQSGSWVKFSSGDASINDLYDYIDGSLDERDLRIDNLEASIVRIDASLDDVIDGLSIFIPSASIGYGLDWNAGLLDVSISSFTANGSTNAFPLFDGAGGLKNSIFAERSGIFTMNNSTGNLVIQSAQIGGDLIIKTTDNGSADFYLDPRNGIVRIGRDQTKSDVRLQAGGTLSNINLHLQPAGNGETRIYGGIKTYGITEVSTYQVLYYNSSTNQVTFGNAPFSGTTISGTANYIPKFNLTGNGLIDTSIYQLDNSIYIGTNKGETAIYGPRLKPSSGATSYFYFNGDTPYFYSSSNLLQLTASGAPGFIFSWDSGNLLEKISFNTTYGGTGAVPLFLVEGGTQFTTPNGSKGGNLMLQGGPGADASYGGGDLILAGGKTGSTITGNIKLVGLDSSIENYILYYRPDSSIVTYGTLSSGATSLSALTDVSIVGIANNNILQYDSGSSKWKNVAPLDGSAYFQSKITKNTIPGTSTTGIAGDWAYDSSYLYLCTSTNKWGRILLDYSF